MPPVTLSRLNHAVLFVRNVERSVAFYQAVFGFEVIGREGGGRMAFLRAEGGANHHDLGLFEVGENAPSAPRGATGLYHLAWEVPALEDLATARATLAELGALVGQSDHGATKSLYAVDPDGNEFEVMWMVPRAEWGDYDRRAITAPLNLEREIAARS
ncbi:MAG: VOC family protein [Dehalococcoidia bacterium]|nr:VOC family protein [Dehalococcoidia bacterium]